VEFENFRYLNKKDTVEFWHPNYPISRCSAYVAGKTAEYMLLKIPEYHLCKRAVSFTVGSYLKFFSQDMLNNLTMGKELLKVLLKKRLALAGLVDRHKQELDQHIDKTNLVSKRYQLLRDKLDAEWRGELSALEEDRTQTLKNDMDLKVQLDELDRKLERYKIEDENFQEDKWSLDPRFYYKK